MPTIMLILETEKGPATGENRRESIGSPFRLCSLPNRYSVYRPVFLLQKILFSSVEKNESENWVYDAENKEYTCPNGKAVSYIRAVTKENSSVGNNIKTMIWIENEKKKKEAQQPAA